MTSQTFKKIPPSERLMVTFTKRSGAVFYITSKEQTRDVYYIYRPADGGFERIGKAKSPPELEAKYIK